MSEQFQSVLNEIENKFDQSFSEMNLEQSANKGLNPQSAKKLNQKLIIEKKTLDHNIDQNDDEMKMQFLKELNQLNLQSEINKEQQKQNNMNNNQKNVCSKQNKKQNTPNFKQTAFFDDQDAQDLRKVISQQQFHYTGEQALRNFNTDKYSEESPYYYKELTMKLQRALKKISSSPGIQISTHNPSSSTFYSRIDQFSQKKQRQIQRKRQQLLQYQVKQMKDRPMINSHSRSIIEQINNQPIYKRCDKIIEQRKKKQQQNKRKKQERQQKEYQQYRKEHQDYMQKVKQKHPSSSIRSSQQYYHEMQVWQRNKQKTIQSKKQQNIQKQKIENTFKPLINSKSQKILSNKKIEKQRYVPIYERQLKAKQEITDPNCTFKPKINKSNFYKKMAFYQQPF